MSDLELSLRMVRAFPKASRMGFDCSTLRDKHISLTQLSTNLDYDALMHRKWMDGGDTTVSPVHVRSKPLVRRLAYFCMTESVASALLPSGAPTVVRYFITTLVDSVLPAPVHMTPQQHTHRTQGSSY